MGLASYVGYQGYKLICVMSDNNPKEKMDTFALLELK
jgi:hypothetical protein